ncbi:MAG: hypothetical protein J6X78_03015 [Treponema sp.]|nr:hypothetical protein [Treponema sp.]
MEKEKADKLIVKYSSKVYGFAVKKSFSYDEAEELSGEMLKELYLSMLHAEDIVNPEGYVWRICEHVYAKYVNQKKLQKGVSLEGFDLPYFDEHDFGETEAQIKKLRKEIGFLSASRREIVYSFYYEDKSIVQIAKEQGLPEGTVKWHLNKARNDLKEGFTMERKIGSLGISPVTALDFSHWGRPGTNGGPEYYLGDKICLNIVYSVYENPKTVAEIAEDLGMTPVYLEDKIEFLVANGFLVETKGKRYTTYVRFSPRQFSLEAEDNVFKMQQKAAKLLVENYVQKVRDAIADVKDVYIPDGNRELFEAACIFYGITTKCTLPCDKDLSKCRIKTLDGGDFFATVNIKSPIVDPHYKETPGKEKYYEVCGAMTRASEKYPCLYSWSVDTKLDSRTGHWQNNLDSDYEAVYEVITKAISDDKTNSEKFKRLRERDFITKAGKINIMVVKGPASELFDKIPKPDEKLLSEFAKYALEQAMVAVKQYPPQLQDFVIVDFMQQFIGNRVALMVMYELYENGIFRPLTKQEKVTANLLMFADTLPE